MRDPLLELPNDPPLPDKRLSEQKIEEWYRHRPVYKLENDLIEAFNQLHEIRRRARSDADRLRQAVIDTRKQLQSAKLRIWILGGVAAAELSIIGWLVKAFLDRFGR